MTVPFPPFSPIQLKMKNHPLRLIGQLLAAMLMLTAGAGSLIAAAPNISVEQPAGTGIASGGSSTFTSVVVGSSGTAVTFTIKNTGDAVLNVSSITKTGLQPGAFTVSGPVSSTVPITTGTTTFTVQFSPTVRGNNAAVIHIPSNDTVTPDYTINVSGTGLAPEIAVEQPAGTTISSGSVTPVSFTSVALSGDPNTATSSLTFTITNSGSSVLNLTGTPKVAVSGTNAADFTVTTQPAATVAASGGTTTFVVQFKPSATGTRIAALSIANDDPDGTENPYLIAIAGVGTAPEIVLEQPAGTEVPTATGYNGEKDFGNVVIGSNSKLTFTISNTGNAPLTGVAITPASSGDFTLASPPPTSVAANSTATFSIDFIPSGTGAKSGTFSIANNDPNGAESPFVLHVIGTGTTPPTGTDGFGYTYTTAPPTAVTLKETDPDVTNAAALTGDDIYMNLNIGFTFYFYDNAYSTCAASTNGLIMFGAPSTDYTPDVPFPNTNAPNNIIAPFWVDLFRTASSKILYTTRGSAPNRVFIMEFQDMQEFGNASGLASFQVQLFEGTNAIEFQYKKYQGFGSGHPDVGIGIENATGTVGISIPKPTQLPYGVRFTRPSVVSVESQYTRPDGTVHDIGDLARGLSPEIGTYKYAYGSLKRFEAPTYIYLDQGFGILNEAGNVNGAANQVAWYRLANRGYSIDGQQVQGTDAFVELSLTHDFKIVWRWELEFAVNIKFVGVGTPTPEVGRHWFPLNSPLTASVDTLVDSDSSGVRLKTTGYKITSYGPLGPLPPVTSSIFVIGTRATTAPLTVTSPMQLEWLTTGQVRYRFSAASGVPGESNVAFDGLPFVRVYDVNGNNPVTTYGTRGSTDVWINSDPDKLCPVEVGAFYRTSPDNGYTLADFPVPPGGDLAPLGLDISRLTDKQIPERSPSTASRLARTIILNSGALATRSRPTPTEIMWVYMPTVYRAEVPLGMAFDPTKTMPPLVDGVNTRILSDEGPSEATFENVGDVLTGKKSASMPLRWDQVDLKLYPVMPDTHRLTWVDKNDRSKSYKIEIVSGYPGQTVNLTSEREDADGTRQGSAPDYVSQTTLDTIAVTNPGVGFPAQAENAHYHHLFDPSSDRRPPTKLDISATDEWKFLDMTYTDKGTDATANIADPGVTFNAQAAGRSVVLYSYRPNPDEIADGSLTKEKLAVRVIRSSAINPVAADDAKLVLGRRGLELGGGSAQDRGAFGVVQPSGTSTVDLGTSFVVDFWLNAKNAQDIPVMVANCSTDATTTVTCTTTSGLVAGMSISGENIATGTKIASITDSTHFELSDAATDSGTSLSLTASGKSVTILTTKNDNLKVVLDPSVSTITATYFGVSVTKLYSTSGAAWRHHVIHVFANQLSNGPEATVLDYYVDGVRDEVGFVTTTKKAVTDTAKFDVGTSLTSDSLRLGVDADPASQIQMDQFRLFSLPSLAPAEPWLTGIDVLNLRTKRNIGSNLRATSPLLWFSFDIYPSGGTTGQTFSPFANTGSLTDLTIGPIVADVAGVYAGTLAHVDIQEVATRLECPLDNAGFGGSGYVLNKLSNYNADIYNRTAEVGAWGTIFPVNDKQLYTQASNRLEVAYYENPYRTDRYSHPNVAWPYESALYDEVKYPAFGPHKDKAIYIASRVGSEGVDRKNHVQKVFSLDRYAGLKIYNQPDRGLPGFNPNEEHALVAQSGRAALKLKNLGEAAANNPPLAAFALQADLNAQNSSYTSDPWALVQVNNLVTGEPEMHAYHVFKTRPGTLAFPRPSDTDVAAVPGLAYESATSPDERMLTLDTTKSFNFRYEFSYPVFAGDSLIPPYPLNLVIGNVAMPARGGNSSEQRALWWDVNSNPWVVSGNSVFFYQYHYPFRSDFYLPGIKIGEPVAWVPDRNTDGTRTFTGDTNVLQPGKVIYNTFWRSDYPKLKRGETLTYQGGEYFAETPGAKGLPALVAMKAAEIVFDVGTPTMVLTDSNIANYSARIMRPLDRQEARFTVAQMATAGFSPASPKIFVIAERWYFKDLPGSLSKRFYFDSLAEKLVFRGYLNDKDSGNKDLTVGPDPLNILEPNVLQPDDLTMIKGIGTGTAWTTAVQAIYDKSMNPMMIRDEAGAAHLPVTGQYLAGLKESAASTQKIGLNIALLGANANVATLTTQLNAAVQQQVILNAAYSFLNVTNSQATANSQQTITTLTQQLALELQSVNTLTASITALSTPTTARYAELDSFGVGSALVPNPTLLTSTATNSRYITIAENNRSELNGAPISLHIIEILPDRYRGAIKVIESADAFSEKVSLQHNGEFGGNVSDLYYEWWIRDATSLDEVAQEVLPNGTLKEFDASGNTLWQQYLPKDRLANNNLNADQKHLGLNSIVFEGRPDLVLADKLVLMRYRHKNESNWTLVPFEVANHVTAWKPGTPAPFQWAGAANSPQLQADGSKRYVPQLVMGWVKRVLDRINPYEARYNDFFSNESPATYSSQIQIAGAPYAGNVALNPDKNVIENTGLIELYMTVLNRAKALSIDNSSNGNASDGVKQALLLAATRLSVLYELLAREAYSDAQDSTINAGEDGGLLGVASYTHAFQNMESDLMHEELALLRGTDFLKSYPVYNRLFWNYAKGLGEAAYNVNYNIYDVNKDGFINEDDARKLYPQGHGDAWGHFLSATRMHYTLLQHPGFSWKARSELYSLMQNVLEVDYLDEKTFARLAAGKARAGRDIVRDTYRVAYTQDPDGQWQGYTDSADPARAWGVSEWAHRAGQGAWFDCAVANALLPDQAAGTNPENLDDIDRKSAVDDIGEIVGGLHEIQIAMDEANGGVNPLGFDSDALTFDIELQFYDNSSGGDRRSHFEQVLSRAFDASGNALTTLEYATQSGNKLRSIADDTNELIDEAMSQDLDFRNRLIEIFGRPYDGTIGFGKAYPEGYEGPDTLLFAYLDKTKIDQIVPPIKGASDDSKTITYQLLFDKATGSEIMNNAEMNRLYGHTDNNEKALAFESLLKNSSLYRFGKDMQDLSVPYKTASRYAFQAPADWGQRTSYGSLQGSLQDMLSDEIELDTAIADYIAFLKDFEEKVNRLKSELELNAEKEGKKDAITATRASINTAMAVFDAVITAVQLVKTFSETPLEAVHEGLPTSIGFSNDVTSIARGIAAAGEVAARDGLEVAKQVGEVGKTILELVRDEVIARLERDIEQRDEVRELEGMLEDLESHMGNDRPKRNAIGAAIQNLEVHRQAYITAQAAGFRLLREREAFNKALASKVQKNRYQDMIFRLSRNEAMSKYQSAFNNAARYAWLAARAYDYETSLDPGHPAAPGSLMDKIVKERQLGLWVDGEPQVGSGGLAEILAQLKGNFEVLNGQLGINNPQGETEKISLRGELFRIMSYDQEVYDAFDTPVDQRTPEQVQLVTDNPDAPASRARWQDALKARIVPDLNQMPEFVRHCRPFAAGVQPGIVIRFPTCIEPGRNVFGLQLAAGDHNYSTANYATKLQTCGVWLDHYAAAGLTTSPRAYLVPIGNDYLRTSTSTWPIIRKWSIVEERIPTPFTINQTHLTAPDYIPSLNGVDGVFGELRRHGDFRMYHDEGDPEAGDDDTITANTRLIGRSVWNSEWMLVIPGADLHYDPSVGLEQFADTIADIKLYFLTYSHQGQ